MDLQSLEILDTLADVAQGSGDEALCQRSVDLAHGIFDSDFLSSSDLEECARLRAKFAVWASREQALTSMKLAHPDLAPDERRRLVEAGFLMSDAWKARALLGGLTERRRGVRTPERAAALAGLEAANRSRLEILARVSSALRSGVPIERVESLVAEADAARRDADGIASRIRQAEVAIEAASADAGRTPEDLRRTLPDDRTALVEYAESNSRLQAYVVTRTSFELLDLGERARIGSRAAEFVTGLRAESPASRDRILELAHELYGDLLKPPLAAVGGAVEQLVIVPTTLVASLPFDALVMEPAHGAPGRPARFEDAAFVVRKYTVTYAASAAVLAELAALPDRIEPRSLLAMVDPAYPPSSDRSRAGDPSPAPTLQGGGPAVAGLPRLARSREEGGRLARIFAASGTGATAEQLVEFEAGRLDTLEAERFLLLAGPEATAERFRGDAARFSILHVAAHGFADFTDPDGGALALTPRGGSSGLLTYREVLRMHLTAELTVLSACDTGLGPELAGEGVLSLARAFTLAGSRSVVASLWPVYDRQASEMMDAFYRAYLFGGASVPVALRQAKLRAMTEPGLDGREKRGGRNADSPAPQGRLAECADPWYWAAFVSLAPIR